jgi:tight adherence protein B
VTRTWLALAFALLIAPAPSASVLRVRALAVRGRLAGAHRAGRPRAASGSVRLGSRGAHRCRGPRGRSGRRSGLAALLGCLAGVVGAGVAVVGAGVALAVAAAAAGLTSAVVVRAARARRESSASDQALLGAVRLLVAELEAGSRADAALDAAALASRRHAPFFTAAAQAARDGDDVGACLLACDEPDLIPLGHAWRVASVAGAPVAHVLARVGDDIEARDQQRRTVTTALAGPRSSALLLAGLPALGVGLGAAMGARPLAFLFGTAAGKALCCAGVVLDSAGVLWTARLMRRAERA